VRLKRGARLQASRNFLKKLGKIDQPTADRIVERLKSIRLGKVELIHSRIDPNLFHFYEDDFVIPIVVSDDRRNAVVTALTVQAPEDLM
jgi:hypothetical protein